MTISLAEVQDADAFANPELRTIARYSGKNDHTVWYRVTRKDEEKNEEVAFVAVGRLEDHLFTHQLFVPRALRGRGIGSAVLRNIEQLARSEACGCVRVWPRPLDDSIDAADLELWYRHRGYDIIDGGTGDMEKRVALGASEREADLVVG